jgi:hypothetical protein
VLGTPPAFILSQDQTRHPMFISHEKPRVLFHCCARSKLHKCLLVRRLSSSSQEMKKSLSIDRNCHVAKTLPIVSVPVLLSTLQLLRSICCRNDFVDVLVRFRCLFILPYPLRFVKGFFRDFFVALKTHLFGVSET